MYFEWVYRMMTPAGKKDVDSGNFHKDTLPSGKRTATSLGPDSLKKAGWRNPFGNVHVKLNSYEELVLKAFSSKAYAEQSIFKTKPMGK